MIVNTVLMYVNDDAKRKEFLRDVFHIDGLTKVFDKTIIETNYERAKEHGINFYLLTNKENNKMLRHCLQNKEIKIINNLDFINEHLENNVLFIHDNFVLNENWYKEIDKISDKDLVFFKNEKNKLDKEVCLFKANMFENHNGLFDKKTTNKKNAKWIKNTIGTKLTNFKDLANYDLSYMENRECLIYTPGPLNIRYASEYALTECAVHHRSELAKMLNQDLAKNILYLFQAKKGFPIAMLSTGLACIESCFENLTLPNDKALVLNNGFFGQNLYNNALRYKLDVEMIKKPLGESFDLEEIKQKIVGKKFLFMTHLETSSGVLNDVESVSKICKEHDVMLIVDAVSSLVNHEFKFDKWNVTATVGTSTKGLEICPGISFVCVSKQGLEIAKNIHKYKDQTSIYLNWNTHLKRHISQGMTSSTYPMGTIAAFNDAVDDIKLRGGIKAQYKFKKDLSTNFLKTLVKNGFESLVQDPKSLSSWLVTLRCPENISAKALRAYLYVNYNYLIETGIGDETDKILRIGIPVNASNKEVNILLKEMLTYCKMLS